jgi:predicted Rossmann fold flavoprotein
MIYDVCIVGAGASGLFAAQYLSDMGFSIILVEGNDTAGRKLKLTGNGRCNLTNDNMESSCFYCNDDSFVNSVINKVPKNRLISEFKKIFLDTVDINGYYYPSDLSSQSVINALMTPIINSDIKIVYKTKIREVMFQNGIFCTYGDKSSADVKRPLICESKKLILACGGASYPKTGSDGSGIKILEKLNLKVERPLPALVPLICNNKNISLLKGLRHSEAINLEYKNQNVFETGEIQYTEDGLSGIAIFQISRIAVHEIQEKTNSHIYIDHLPDYSFEELKNNIWNRFYSNKYSVSVKEALNSLIPDKLITYILKELLIDEDLPASELEKENAVKLLNKIKKDKFEIIDYKGFDKAQTVSGGIDISELDRCTMEVKSIPGLYVTGEMINCDGICGGYNLHFAFSTAIIACDGIKEKYASDKSN